MRRNGEIRGVSEEKEATVIERRGGKDGGEGRRKDERKEGRREKVS